MDSPTIDQQRWNRQDFLVQQQQQQQQPQPQQSPSYNFYNGSGPEYYYGLPWTGFGELGGNKRFDNKNDIDGKYCSFQTTSRPPETAPRKRMPNPTGITSVTCGLPVAAACPGANRSDRLWDIRRWPTSTGKPSATIAVSITNLVKSDRQIRRRRRRGWRLQTCLLRRPNTASINQSHPPCTIITILPTVGVFHHNRFSSRLCNRLCSRSKRIRRLGTRRLCSIKGCLTSTSFRRGIYTDRHRTSLLQSSCPNLRRPRRPRRIRRRSAK